MLFNNASRKERSRVLRDGVITFVFVLLCQQNAFAMQDNELLRNVVEGLADAAKGAAENIERRAEARKYEEAGISREINRLKESGASDTDPRITDLQRRLKNMDKDADAANKAGDVGLGILQMGANAVIGSYTAERDAETAQRKVLADRFMHNKGMKEIAQMFLDPENLAKMALFAAGTTLGVAGVYYTVKLAYQYAEARMGKPSLIRESSIDSFRHTFNKFVLSLFKSDEEIENILGDIILSPDIQDKVYLLAEDTRQTKEYSLPYQNVLFYGPPGTGKTEFARILARYSGMDYAILSGADFSQFKDGEGITELHKLFDWANNSKKGLIIFIDEADACFRDRATLDKDGVNLVNAFLSHTGCSSDKFMIVLATNYEDELDAAVRSRIHKKVPFLLPSVDDRFKILKLKIKKYIIDDKRIYYKDSVKVEESLTVHASVTDSFYKEIAAKIDGFSGRDIDQIVGEMRMRAYRSGKNVLTTDIVNSVVNDKITQLKKDKEATAYQKRKFDKALNS